MRTKVTTALVAAFLLVAPLASHAAVDVTVDPLTITNGFMNVFELPSNGGGYVFGSVWGVPDLTATWSGNNVTLGPNCIGDPSPFWYIGGGGPGQPGNKIMDANLYAEPAGSLPGQTVIFTARVIANTLTPAHPVVAFIRDFAPDFSSFNAVTVPLGAPGTFSISLATVNDPARHVQWGFEMIGVNVWITDLAPFGSITIGPDGPTPAKPTSWGRVKAMFR